MKNIPDASLEAKLEAVKNMVDASVGDGCKKGTWF